METININWNDLKSIKKAEKKKAQLENECYTLINTNQINFNKQLLTYERFKNRELKIEVIRE